MKTLISWLGDVYQRNGYVAVLVAVAVIVGLALLVASVGGVSLVVLGCAAKLPPVRDVPASAPAEGEGKA